jgi:Niemann-Pick C1 protein
METFSRKWTNVVLRIQRPVIRALFAVSNHAALRPKSYVVGTILLSVFLLVLGLLTNFTMDLDEDKLWTPKGSRLIAHGDWLEDDSGFPTDPRVFSIIVHMDGDNVLSQEGVRRVFAAVDAVRSAPGYDELCAQSTNTNFVNADGEVTCEIVSVTKFFNHSLDVFNSEVKSDEEAIDALSATMYPDDGTPVDLLAILGNAERDETSGKLTTAQMYLISIGLPDVDDAYDFEKDALDAIWVVHDAWEAEESNLFRLEAFASRSFSDEFMTAIMDDSKLID